MKKDQRETRQHTTNSAKSKIRRQTTQEAEGAGLNGEYLGRRKGKTGNTERTLSMRGGK